MDDPELRTGYNAGLIAPSNIEITMAFQPIVDVETQTIHAYEALVRGPGGESAESVLLAVNDGNSAAFDQSCRVMAIETAAKLGLDRRLHINILPTKVEHPEESLQLTLATARAHNFPIDLITFEFTEDERIADQDHIREIATVYRRNGLNIALDDFGAGYAGLSLLAAFQPDVVKIDRVLISNIDRDRPRQVIIKGVMKIASDLGLQVVAEGVERREEMSFLRDVGIRYVQGFLFAAPAGRLLRDDEIRWT